VGFDRKYGRVTTEHDDIPDDEPVIVFRARDKHLPAVLNHYLTLCELSGSPDRHLALIRRNHERIVAWQQDHPGEVRNPDSERSRAWMS
jgi:hypothetical protein